MRRTAPSSTGWRRRSSSSSRWATAAGRAPPVRSSTSGSSSTSDPVGFMLASPPPGCTTSPRIATAPVTSTIPTSTSWGSCSRRCASSVRRRCCPGLAILSWEHEPTAGDSGYVPVWGEVQEDHIQIRPRRRILPGRHPRRDRAAGAARSGDHRRPHRHRPAADTDPRAGPDRTGRPQPAAVATRSRPGPGAVLGGAPQPHLLARQVEGPRRPGARPGDRPSRTRGGATAPVRGERGWPRCCPGRLAEDHRWFSPPPIALGHLGST